MTVDRLRLCFDYHSESIHSLSAFCSKCCLFLYLLNLPTFKCLIKECMKLESNIWFTSILSFDVLYVQIFI